MGIEAFLAAQKVDEMHIGQFLDDGYELMNELDISDYILNVVLVDPTDLT